MLTLDQLDPKQREAVSAAVDLNNRLVAITGGAGTGKTSISRITYDALVNAGFRVGVCAPTGKAAKRIYEATGIRAVTVHKLLEYSHPGERDPKTGKPMIETRPKRDRDNPLEFDVVLADEYPMMNHELHRNLIDALPAGGRLIAVGDINQLPPIEKSDALARQDTPFMDLLKRFKGITLETIHRQGEGSGIVENGARIMKGFSPIRRPDFPMDVTDQPVDAIKRIIIEAEDKGINFGALDNQIITPQNISFIGQHALNGHLQPLLNDRINHEKSISLPRHEWDKKHPCWVTVGDKVINTQNIYDLTADNGEEGLFNGEVGIIEEVTEFDGIIVNFGDRKISIPPVIDRINYKTGKAYAYDPRKEIYLAYAVTTHKMQGSECKHVVYVMNKCAYRMLNRNNFYTGVTRARLTAHVVTDMRGLSAALTNTRTSFK